MSPKHQVTVQRRIQAAPEAVWEVVTDLDQAAARLSQVTELHRITPDPYDVGTRWRERRRMVGSSETQELEVVENVPLRRTVTQAVDGNTTYRTTLVLESLDDAVATLVTATFAATSEGDQTGLRRLALQVIGPLGLKLTEKSLRTELEDIAAAAEQISR